MTEYLTHIQVQQRYGVSKRCLNRWIQRGLFPRPIRPGGPKSHRRLFKFSDILEHENQMGGASAREPAAQR